MRIDEDNLKNGLLAVVVTLVDLIKDVLEHQALRRIEAGTLTEEEVERLGKALMELDKAVLEIKREHGLEDSVRKFRGDLDNLATDVLNTFNPERWKECKADTCTA